MKLLFAHDHIFYKYGNDYYSNGSFPKEALLRYTSVFDDVRFVSRQIQLEEKPANMSLATTERLKFINVPNFKSLRTYKNKHKAKKIIAEEVRKADYVIARTSSIGSIAIRYARKYKKPYLIEVVGCARDSLWNHGSVAGKILAPYSYIKMKKTIKSSPYVIYVTNEFLQNRYPTTGKNTNCSNVNIKIQPESVLEDRLRKILKDKDKIILGTIGAINIKYKGHDMVIKALSLLKDELKIDIEYRVVGGGKQTYLKELSTKYGVADLIRFEGRLPSGEPIYDFLDNIDIYLQPSKTEGLPRAVIEAMSRGCPIIGSDAGGIPELINKDAVFNKRDYKSLANIIKNRIQDKQWMLANATRNFEESKKYDKDKIEERRDQFLRNFKSENKKW